MADKRDSRIGTQRTRKALKLNAELGKAKINLRLYRSLGIVHNERQPRFMNRTETENED